MRYPLSDLFGAFLGGLLTLSANFVDAKGHGYEVKRWSGQPVTARSLVDSLQSDITRHRHSERGVVGLGVAFEFNSDRLTDRARETLREIPTAMNSEYLRPFAFEVQCHLDAKSASSMNLVAHCVARAP